MRLHESNEIVENQEPTLLNVLNGASPDYAVVAQKGAAPELLDRFDAVFAREYGLSVEVLAMRYESNIKQNFSGAIQLAHRLVEQSESMAQQAEARAQQTQQRLAEREDALAQTQQRLAEREDALAQTQQRLAEREGELISVYQSKSWKLTWPLRIVNRQVKQSILRCNNGFLQLKDFLRGAARKVLLFLLNYIRSRPQRKPQVARLLAHFPKLDARLRAFAMWHKLGGHLTDRRTCTDLVSLSTLSRDEDDLSKSAARVLRDLKRAIKR
jgi:O-antigen chain-terminating methyltransferase